MGVAVQPRGIAITLHRIQRYIRSSVWSAPLPAFAVEAHRSGRSARWSEPPRPRLTKRVIGDPALNAGLPGQGLGMRPGRLGLRQWSCQPCGPWRLADTPPLAGTRWRQAC